MTVRKHHVIVGGSAAGVAAAFALRNSGFDGTVTVVEAGSELPYERPPLSKALTGGRDVFLRPIALLPDYRAAEIDMRLGTRVRALDPATRTVLLSGGGTLTADRVLLATGVSARLLNVPGSDLPGVLTLRDVDDARQVAAAIAAGGPVVVIGGGFIGMEVAAAARTAGCDVTVVETSPLPLLHALGRPLAELVAELHRAHGVRLRTGTSVAVFHGAQAVEEVELVSGERLPAAVVVVGVGVVPNDALAGETGVLRDRGIVVDGHGRTAQPWILAAGDVTVQPHPHLAAPGRIEHWDNAQRQGAVAGAAMAGNLRAHDAVPYFWSEQYGLTLQMFGRPRPGDELVLRPDSGPWRFVGLWLRYGAVAAAAGLAAPREMTAARRLVERSAPVPAERLRDPTTDLRRIARQ
ncbi:FAD-dependent oxidoreductase [Streptomyces griseorubiginosus]|uniref:NAD(P)/FAD-dependent oxidoreductase n=1 Tax=Streptomyces griseorubiginosus TaxID=67304 RepID=UPI0033BB3A35